MPPQVSPALVLPEPPNLRSLQLGRPPAAVGVFVSEIALTPSRDGAVAVARAGREHGLWRLVSALGDIVGLLAIAYAFPVVILAVGIPIALFVRLMLWVVGRL